MRPRPDPRRLSPIARLAVVMAGALAVVTPSAARAWDVLPGSDDLLRAFHRHVGSSVYPWARHGAKPLGLTGFELYAEVSADQDFDGEPAAVLLDDDLPLDLLSVARVGLRKGLPGGFDIGASYGVAVDGELDLLAVELGYALISGGALSPAVGVRVTGSDGSSPHYDLRQYGAELLISKGFTAFSLFGGAGVVRSEGDFGFDDGTFFSTDETQEIFYAGVAIKVLLPRLTVTLEQGEALQAAIRVGIGF